MSQLLTSVFMNHLICAAETLGVYLPSLPCRVLDFRESVPSGLCGSYVCLLAEGTQHLVGVLSRPLGWETLSGALDHDCPLPQARGIVEAACELGTIMTERFQARLGCVSAGAIGLPLFAEGPVRSHPSARLLAADIALGDTLALLVLFSRPQTIVGRATRCGRSGRGGD